MLEAHGQDVWQKMEPVSGRPISPGWSHWLHTGIGGTPSAHILRTGTPNPIYERCPKHWGPLTTHPKRRAKPIRWIDHHAF